MTALAFEHVSHRYGGRTAVADLSLRIEAGEIVCLLGPSGCGKSTTLRLAAGLERLQAGRILIADQVAAEPGAELPPERRGVGLVFQDSALFPHLTVWQNVAFGLKGAAADRRRRALSLLERVHLTAFADVYPHTLSGGEQQRVGLCRAMAVKPRVMLMDEPFSGLDTRLRQQVREETLSLLADEGTPTLLVTHDPEEAMRMADRIALMQEGRVVQIGPPEDLYDRPANPFVVRFFGEASEIEVPVDDGVARTPFGPMPAGACGGPRATLVIRPQAIRATEAGGVEAIVGDVRPLGPARVAVLTFGGHRLLAHFPTELALAPGAAVRIGLGPRDHFLFPAQNG